MFKKNENNDAKLWTDRELDQELREWQVRTFFNRPSGFSENQKIEILKKIRNRKV